LLVSTPVTTRTETLDLDRSTEHLTSKRQISYPVPIERTTELEEKYSIQTSRSFPIYNAQNAINCQNISLENENIRHFERCQNLQQMPSIRSEESLQMDSFKFVLKTQLEMGHVKFGGGDDNCDSDLKARSSASKNSKMCIQSNVLDLEQDSSLDSKQRRKHLHFSIKNHISKLSKKDRPIAIPRSKSLQEKPTDDFMFSSVKDEILQMVSRRSRFKSTKS